MERMDGVERSFMATVTLGFLVLLASVIAMVLT